MSSTSSSDVLAISGICVVSDSTRTPEGYERIRNAYDDPTMEAKIHKDTLFRKVDRFLCVSRYPFKMIVSDILIIGQAETSPPGYIPLDATVDTKEKATQKKTIYVRMSPRNPGAKAISDVIFMARQKKPPPGFSLIGDLNGLMMCYKEFTIPGSSEYSNTINGISGSIYPGVQTLFKQPIVDRIGRQYGPRDKQYGATQQYYLDRELSQLNQDIGNVQLNCSLDDSMMQTTTHKKDDMWLISSIPFKLTSPAENRRLKSTGIECVKEKSGFDHFVNDIEFLDEQQIDQKYVYDFKLERAWVS